MKTNKEPQKQPSIDDKIKIETDFAITGNPQSKSVLVEECNKKREETPEMRNNSTFGNRERRDDSSEDNYVDDDFESSKKESMKEATNTEQDIATEISKLGKDSKIQLSEKRSVKEISSQNEDFKAQDGTPQRIPTQHQKYNEEKIITSLAVTDKSSAEKREHSKSTLKTEEVDYEEAGIKAKDNVYVSHSSRPYTQD